MSCKGISDTPPECTRQGIKRHNNEPDRWISTLLTRPCFLPFIYDQSPTNYNDVVIRTAFPLAFPGFLHVGQCTYRETDQELGQAFGKWYLTKRSIRVGERGLYMELTIPSSKTDPFRKEIKLTITVSNDSACPVYAMQQFRDLDTNLPQHAPLFCIGQHK